MQVAKGLQYVHACGLIHRDLKPANCFLMAEGTVKIGVRRLSSICCASLSMFVCVCVCMMSACLSCLFFCLPACLLVCMSDLSVRLFVYG